YFLDRTVDTIFAFERGQVRSVPGNFSAYLEQRQTEATAAPRGPVKPTYQQNRARKLSFQEQRELRDLEEGIPRRERRAVELEDLLASGSSQHQQVQAWYEELEQLRQRLDRDLERWAELADIAG
ncbi:MAG: ABC transporter C-terminal domain-containing protein, partial [Candidatus Eremiobacterota bacterium]